MATGGVGEAMLISAITGAGTSAITGGDPLKGALMGAATGGIGAGIAGAGTSAATSAATQAGTAAATPIVPGLDAAATSATTMANPYATLGADPLMGGAPIMPEVPAMDISALQATDLSAPFPTAGQAGTTGTPTFPKINEFYSKNPMMVPAGLGVAGAALIPPEGLPEDEEYSGPLSRFRYDPDRYRPAMASGGLADSVVAKRYMKGGHLGAYSDGGRLTKGPGDGMSDDIPAKIGARQPARLADGEFVIPADVVSGIGNGSTDAGARRLYAMMDKVRKARTGTKRQGKEINASKYMPA